MAQKIGSNYPKYLFILIFIFMGIYDYACAFISDIYTDDIDKYNHNFTLSGKGAYDIADVAAAQIGMEGSALGYQDLEWDAAFVIDCAALAGQSLAIPFVPGITNDIGWLLSYIIYNGGYEVPEPQTGDLVFYYCTKEQRYVHVGIMESETGSIHGNVSNRVQRLQNPLDYIELTDHDLHPSDENYGNCSTISYVRPNYEVQSLAEVSDGKKAMNTGFESGDDHVDMYMNAENRIENDMISSPNLLNHDNDLLGYAFCTGGELCPSASYYVSDYMKIEEGKEYEQLVFSPASWMYLRRSGGQICFYDKNKKLLTSTDRSISRYTAVAPVGAVYARFSSLATDYRLYDMFGEKEIMEQYRGFPLWIYVPNGFYSSNVTITEISSPFVDHTWGGDWIFKFNIISYKEFTGADKEIQYASYMLKKYKSKLQVSNGKSDVMKIEENEAFVYSFRKKAFIFVSSAEIEPKDIILLHIKNDKPYGLIYDTYLDELAYMQERIGISDVNEEILRAADSILEESNVMTDGSREDIFTFIHVSDNHHVGNYGGTYSNATAAVIRYLHSRYHFDAIFNTGDELLTATKAASGSGWNDGKLSLSNAINSYPIEDLVFCEGNHDRGIIAEQYIYLEEYYNLVLRHWADNPNVHASYPDSYYYRDYPDYKIRTVCLTLYNLPDDDLDVHYQYLRDWVYGYDCRQMEWLCNTALQVDGGWSVIILTHQAPVTTKEGNNGNGSGGVNILALRDILESFRLGESRDIISSSTEAGNIFNFRIKTNFDQQGPRDLIGVFTGHTHIDRIVEINNIYYDAICCGYIDIVEYHGNRGSREPNTVSEVCFDIGVVNLQTKEVKLYRVGFIPTDSVKVRSWKYDQK
ncbi:MAG: metallophosphoesterase [Anaerolineaceae bacterium]|nr:metallophosphoesterase [Anaerolineaceae bacterium]